MNTLFYAAIILLTLFGIMLSIYVVCDLWNFGKNCEQVEYYKEEKND